MTENKQTWDWNAIVRDAELSQLEEPGVTLPAAEHSAMMQEVLDNARAFGERMRTPGELPPLK